MQAAALHRLRDGGTDRLVDLLLDDVLSRPVSELVDPAWLARQLAASAKSAAADPQVEAWFRERVKDARARVPAGRKLVVAATNYGGGALRAAVDRRRRPEG